MTRTPLEERILSEIQAALPNLAELAQRVSLTRPDILSSGYFKDYESEIPIAGVSFIDCYRVLEATRYAMHQYMEQGRLHREVHDPPNEPAAVFLEKFYLDDAALRLYSAAEHLADGIRKMLAIPKSAFGRGGGSEWRRLRKYLKQHLPDEPVAHDLSSLSATEEWQFTIDYRGKWVHNQPPSIAGTGVVFRRRTRWEPSPGGGMSLFIGQGDGPEFTTADLGRNFLEAFTQFSSLFYSVLTRYDEILAEHGITSE